MDDNEFDQPAPVSKSRRKRDMLALQRLGQELLGFNDKALNELAIPEDLLEALRIARKITAHGALRRQLQYIGKLMRDIDTAPLRKAVDARQHQAALHTREFHLIEELREALITEGDAALSSVLEQFPAVDRQHVRKLARQAHKERESGQPPGASRRLFRYLRELQENN